MDLIMTVCKRGRERGREREIQRDVWVLVVSCTTWRGVVWCCMFCAWVTKRGVVVVGEVCVGVVDVGG